MENQRLKMMINKLFDMQARGDIDNDWEIDFICDMKMKIEIGDFRFSDKQKAKIEELFERH